MRYLSLFTLLLLLCGCKREAAVATQPAPRPITAPAPAPPAPRAERPTVTTEQVATATTPQQSEADKGRIDLSAKQLESRLQPPDISGRRVPPAKSPPATTPERMPSSAGPAPEAAEVPSVAAITSPVLFEIKTSPCRGFCKQYAMRLHEDGQLVLHGIRNVQPAGYHLRRLNAFALRDLRTAFLDLEPENWPDEYSTNSAGAAVDVPTKTLLIPGEDREMREVVIGPGAPPAILDFLEVAEGLIDRGVWIPARE